jgi:hypothetical protein
MKLHQFLSAATSSVVALVALLGMVGAAHASATIDLIWIDKTDPACLDADRRDCPQIGSAISSVVTSDDISLAVLATAGVGGVLGAGVSVNYSRQFILSVVDFGSLATPVFLPGHLGSTTNRPPYIDNINAIATPFAGLGIGLLPGQTAYLGTVSFHKDLTATGVYEIAVGVDGLGGTDGVLGLGGENISTTTTFNSAFMIGIGDPPMCPFEIEVNSIRTTGKTVQWGQNRTVDVTAKARILKGTASPDTTLDTTLEVRAADGTTTIGSASTAPDAIRLGVGKGGKGDKLTVDVPQCNSGYIEFTATFVGTVDIVECIGTRKIRKECK